MSCILFAVCIFGSLDGKKSLFTKVNGIGLIEKNTIQLGGFEMERKRS